MNWKFVCHSSRSRIKQSDQLISIIRPLIAAPQCSISQRRRARERLAKQDARVRTRSSSGAFACECAELTTESRELCTAARRCRGYRGAAHRKVSTHRFCAAKLLALKSIGFLMTGKKKARRNAPAFQAFFSRHGAKRLTFKRCLLAFLWAQFAFLLQAFSFSNKKKMPKRGKCEKFDYSETRR